MTATSLGAGWNLFSFGEPRPDLAFHEPKAAEIWGSSRMLFFHRETFQPKKKTQLEIANESTELIGEPGVNGCGPQYFGSKR